MKNTESARCHMERFIMNITNLIVPGEPSCVMYTHQQVMRNIWKNDILFSIYNMGAARMRLAGSGRESLPISRIT